MKSLFSRRRAITGAIGGVATLRVPAIAKQSPAIIAQASQVTILPGEHTHQKAFERALSAARAQSQFVAGLASYWATPGGAIRLEPGVYSVEDVLKILSKKGMPGTAQLRLFAEDLGDVIIQIPDGLYFSECDERLNALSIRNIGFTGGKGAFVQKYNGISVNGFRRIENCYFDGYTECAIASNAADDPYWRISNCIFMGAEGKNSRAIALGGLLDGTVIEGCSFLRDQYKLVIGPLHSGNLIIRGNDFLSFSKGHTEADILFVPSNQAGAYVQNAGRVTLVEGNKFGNEGLTSDKPRILFAALDESRGAGRHDRQPKPRWSTDDRGAGWLQGIQFRANRWSFNAEYNAPVMLSYVDRVCGVLFDDDNGFDGGRPTYLIEWAGRRTRDYMSATWDIRLKRYSSLPVQGSPFKKGVSNQPIGPIRDEMAGDIGSELSLPWCPPTGNEISMRFCSRSDHWDALIGVTKVDVVDPQNPNGMLVTAKKAGEVAVYTDLDLGTFTEGTAWLTIGLGRSPDRSIDDVHVQIFDPATGTIALSAMVHLPVQVGTLCKDFSLYSPGGTERWQVRLTPLNCRSGIADRFLVANMHVNSGAMPLAQPKAAPFPDLTKAPSAEDFNRLIEILRQHNWIAR